MKTVFQVRLLGPVEVEQEGKLIQGFRSRKALALLAYLAMHNQPVPRIRLAELFWQGKTEARGRANLSWALHRICSQVPGCLKADRHTVQFQRADSYWLDVDVFADLEGQEDLTALAAAVALYRDEFLAGLYLAGCIEFEMWLVKERERWRQRVIRTLEKLVTGHSRRGQYEQGLHFAQQLLDVEPWREETHRQMMRLLAYSGRRTAALAQYEICRRVLAEELGVTLTPETTRLFEQIRDGQLERPGAASDQFLPPAFLPDEEKSLESPLFVARQKELARLDRFLEKVLAGQGQVVFVVGNAGQGKTALIQEFVRRAQATYSQLVAAGGSGQAHTGIGDPYLPFREILGLLTGDIQTQWATGAMDQEQARRLWQILPPAAAALVETGPDLLDLFVPGAALASRAATVAGDEADWLFQLQDLLGRKAALPADPNLLQSALFEQYSRVLERLACRSPLLLVLDDLQWADAGSINLLFHLGRRLESSPILIVGAYRPAEVALGFPSATSEPGKRHPLAAVVNEFKRHFGPITIDLGQAEGRPFVDALLDAEPNRLGSSFRETLYRQTRGHALFTVELLRGMQERGGLVQDEAGRWIEGSALEWETLPVRVEAVIAERIGRLPQQLRDVLSVASVEGETFTAEVIARVQAADEQEMVQYLSSKLDRQHRLVYAQGIRWRDSQSLSLYRFRHILFQRYLYNKMDRIEQVHLHQAVGTALESLYGERAGAVETIEPVAAVAGQLAWHFHKAGLSKKAVDYFRQAGQWAARLSAHEEAIAHFSQALELLETLPESPERAQQELRLQMGLGASLQTTRGFGAPETERVFARAQELGRQVGETPQLFPLLWLLLMFYGTRGKHQTGREIREQLLNLAEQAGDPVLVALAHWMVGWNLFFLGELAQARPYLEHTIIFYDPQQHHSLAFVYGLDPGVVSLSVFSWELWMLGYPEQAMKRSREALSLAREVAHPPSSVLAQTYAGLLGAFRRDWQTVRALAEACIQLSTEHGLLYWRVGGLFCQGWALTRQGQVKEGIDQVKDGIAANRTTGAEALVGLQLAVLAEAYGQTGQVDKGLAALAEALATVNQTGERFYEAELHRLKGELLLKDEGRWKRDESPEECFLQAIEVARQQQARSWELRAVTSLARLWRSQGPSGKREEARKLLADVYSRFTEGFDAPDLEEARRLLEALS